MNPDTPFTTEEIQTILSKEPTFETSMSPDDSPLLRPIVDKADSQNEEKSPFDFPQSEGPIDAPKQPIGEQSQQSPSSGKQPEIPTDAAMLAAQTFLGMFNNVVAVGAGHFIKIQKQEDFYDVEGFISIIDEQNRKNLEKVKLGPEDKAMLQPLIAEMIRKHAVQLSIEQQLVGAVLGILFKKAQLVMEIRTENQLMIKKLVGLIKEAKLGQDIPQVVQKEFAPEPEIEPAEEVV